MSDYLNLELIPLTEMPKELHHWTEVYLVEEIKKSGFNSGGVFLTRNGSAPEDYWNPDIFWMYRPTRITIDTSQLELEALFADPYSGEDSEDQTYSTTGNALYKLEIPVTAFASVKAFMPAKSWKLTNADPDCYGYPENWSQELIDPLLFN